MSVIATAVRHMLASGMSPDVIVSAVADMEVEITAAAAAKEQERLLKQRERTRLSRERRKALKSDDVTLRHVTYDEPVTLRHVSNVTDSPLKKEIKPPTSSSLRSDDTPVPKTTPRLELQAILDPEHAAAVIDHRQRLGSGLTAHAAKLLAAEFAKCANPNAAADVMMSRGWRGFKPKWLEERHNGPAGPPPKPPTGSAKLVELLKKPFEETYGRSNGQEPPGATVLPIRNR